MDVGTQDVGAVTTLRQPGLLWQSIAAWGDLRGSFRLLMASAPSEAKLLFIAILSGLFVFVGNVAVERITHQSGLTTDQEFQAFVAAQLITAAFFRTLALYGAAALLCIILRRFGGQAGWFENRAAFFWAALVAAPVLLVTSVLSAVALVRVGDGAEMVIGQIGGIVFALVLSVCLSEAHGFKRALPVFAGMVAVSLVLMTLAGFLQPGGAVQ